MTYPATVIQVMIASPSDVPDERDAIEKEIHRWNYTHSSTRNVVLMPVRWETHSAPDLGGRPQGLINERILGGCDLLVGVFWTRVGSPTGEFASGTIEEIERHVGNNKPAMLYFSDQPVRMDSVDPKQYAELTKFKQDCYSRGLVSSFENLEDFKTQFRDQLQITLNQHFKEFLGNTSLEIQSKAEPELSDHAKALLKECSKDLGGMILKSAYSGGQFMQTNGKNFTGDVRAFSKWESALDQLVYSGYIKSEGKAFKITNAGFEMADTIDDDIYFKLTQS